VLFTPVVLPNKELKPKAVLLVPIVLHAKELSPTAVLLEATLTLKA
jgi:hypothetical protein